MTKRLVRELYFKRALFDFFVGRFLPILSLKRPISRLVVRLPHCSNLFYERIRHCEPRRGEAISKVIKLSTLARHCACLHAEATQGSITTTAGALSVLATHAEA